LLIPTAASKPRNFGLDVMRATAILLVLGAHAFHIIAPLVPKSISFISLPDGVDVFFVLSGFLVGGIWIDMLERNESGLLKTFFWKRWLRTLPPYFIVITLLFLVRLYFSGGTFTFPWRYFLFVQNMYVPEWDPYYFYPEAWSLSVEEWFYVLMPLSTLFLLRFIQQPKKAVFLFAMVMLVVPFLLRILFYIQHPIESLDDWNRYLRHITVYRLDMIGFGVLAAWLKYYSNKHWKMMRSYKTLGMLLLLASTIIYHFYAFGFMFLSLFYFLNCRCWIAVIASNNRIAEMYIVTNHQCCDIFKCYILCCLFTESFCYSLSINFAFQAGICFICCVNAWDLCRLCYSCNAYCLWFLPICGATDSSI
jgi:peptidoglycan/LPS O-acetylase OafA/YrhL